MQTRQVHSEMGPPTEEVVSLEAAALGRVESEE